MNAVIKLREFASYPVRPATGTPGVSGQRQMDNAIQKLRDNANAFVRLPLADRIALAKTMQQGYLRVADRLVLAGCKAKGIIPGTPAEGEEWEVGPWGVVRQLRLIRESLDNLMRNGNTTTGTVNETPDGRLVVRAFPGNTIDSILFKDVCVDVHMQNGVTRSMLEESRASFYKSPAHDGRVVLVLGAGNILSIPAMDVITKMFNEGKVCLLKMNPVNAYAGPFMEEAFASAIDRGFLAIVYGGAEEGRYLVYHDQIDEVHITGSDKTHDAIVWGPPGPEREARMQNNEPLLDKPITSELGNISPVIVVPGPYTEAELRFQAEDAASYFIMNASFLCCASKMLISPQGWNGSDIFLRGIQDACAAIPPRLAYYPGAEDRWRTLTRDRLNVTRIGDTVPGTLPWTFITGLDPAAETEPLHSVEPFCSVLAETRLGSADPVEFLEHAVDFVNNRLWGTLSATLVIHPCTLRDPKIREAVERAIARLRYGVVAVNGFPGLSFVFAAPPWGAYPGATLQDIQSGTGFVHNTPMLEGIEKTVIRFPLTSFPKPGYFPSNRVADRLVRRVVALEENASWSKLPGVILTAMRG